MSSPLENLVKEKIRSFPTHAEAAAFFDASVGEVSMWDGDGEIPVRALEKVWSGGFTPPEPKRKIALMMASYKETNPLTAITVMTLLDKSRMALLLNYGDAFIAHSRNTLAEKFLNSSSEWALSLDDDMIFPCGDAGKFNAFTGFNLPEKFAGRNTVDRLLSHGKTLIGGLYYGRWPNSKGGMFGEGKELYNYTQAAPRDEVRQTRWCGTGCLLIHRSVFEDIEKKFPKLGRDATGGKAHFFTSCEHDLLHGAEEVLGLLDGSHPEKARQKLNLLLAQSRANSKLGTGEDVIFCQRAAQAGHPCYVDFGLICGHIGTHVYGPRY